MSLFKHKYYSNKLPICLSHYIKFLNDGVFTFFLFCSAWGLVKVVSVIEFTLFSIIFVHTLDTHSLCNTFLYLSYLQNICFEDIGIILYFFKSQHLTNSLYMTDASVICLWFTDWIKNIILRLPRLKISLYGRMVIIVELGYGYMGFIIQLSQFLCMF